jgi:hypothetical protein
VLEVKQSKSQRLAWRLRELPPVTGLSLAYWRKVVRSGALRARKLDGAVIVLDADLQEFLAGAKLIAEPQSASATA